MDRDFLGPCSQPCGGGGVRNRQVECPRADYCNESQPVEEEACGEHQCTWQASDWSECTKTCGSATRSRAITCPRPDMCDSNRSLNSEEACLNPACHWETGSWGPCLGPCGEIGIMERTVVCPYQSECNEQKPSATVRCNTCGADQIDQGLADASPGICSFSVLVLAVVLWSMMS